MNYFFFKKKGVKRLNVSVGEENNGGFTGRTKKEARQGLKLSG